MTTLETEQHLFRTFVEQHSEAAFSRLVETQGALVYSAALRRMNGDAHLAEDVMQEVFALLARKAPTLPSTINLSAWLYCQTCRRSANMVRREQRQKKRERLASELLPEKSDSVWDDVAPLLEQAMESLSSQDREVLVLRYFKNLTHQEVGQSVEISEEAARKRTSRALGKLRKKLMRLGVAVSLTPLGETLAAQAVVAAPVQLLESVSLPASSPPSPLALSEILACKGALGIGCLVGLALSGAVLTATTVPSRENRPLGDRPSSLLAPRAAERPFFMKPAPKGATLEVIVSLLADSLNGPQHDLTRLRRMQIIRAIPLDQMPRFFALSASMLEPKQHASLIRPVCEYWMTQDPESALAEVMRSNLDETFSAHSSGNLIEQLYGDWLGTNLRSAQEWLTQHWREPELQKEAFQGPLGQFLAAKVCKTLIGEERDFEASLAYAQAMPSFDVRLRTASVLTGGGDSWHQAEPRSVSEWKGLLTLLGTLNEQPLRHGLEERLWKSWGHGKPDQALEAAASIENGRDRYRASVALLSLQRTRGKAVYTGSGSSSVPSNPVTDKAQRLDRALTEAEIAGVGIPVAITEIGKALYESGSRDEALAWFQSNEPSPEADEWLARQARRHHSLEGSVAWARTLRDPEWRDLLIAGFFRSMASVFPDEANALLAKSESWSPDQLRYLQSIIAP
jgi:RNA polymerase sigma factor (sigma-70 family)